MSEFDDIRPYNDDEVADVLQQLLEDREFIDSIIALKLPKTGRLLKHVLRPVVQRKLAKQLPGVKTVADFQARIESYLGALIDRTVTNLSVSGLEKLDTSQSYLFISNHRDIAMDPAFVNWTLFHNGFTTLRIAIGDNLLTKPFASRLMRLNKSFIVNRSATKPREKLKAAKLLSRYIQHSLHQDKENIWIAQREGRAKDGIDRTNPAIINMFALSKEKGQDFAEFIGNSRIVPVTISYEYDPCDEAKARELYHKEAFGSYTKEEHEDVQSIAMGISGYKGAVHLAFGEPLTGTFEDADQVAEVLDERVNSAYVLHPTNCFAYEMLMGEAPQVPVGKQAEDFTKKSWQKEREEFLARIEGIDARWKKILLQGYANPVLTKLGQHDEHD